MEHGIRVPATRNEDEIFRHKCLYLSEKVTCIDKLIFLHRNNPASETHKKYKAEDLFGPMLYSWKEFLQWHKEEHPEDTRAQTVYQMMFCGYAVEGIEMLCASKRKLSEIRKIAKEHLYQDDMVSYMPDLKQEKLRNKIEDYLQDPKRFARKCRIKAYKDRFGRRLLKIPFVRSFYLKKKYPADLTGMNLLY